MAATLRPSLTNDPMVSLAQFQAAYSEMLQPEKITTESLPSPGMPPGVPHGYQPPLKAFILQRTISIQKQLEDPSAGYIVREPRQGPNGGPRPGGPPPRPPRM